MIDSLPMATEKLRDPSLPGLGLFSVLVCLIKKEEKLPDHCQI